MQNDLSVVVNALPALVWTALSDGSVDFLNQRWCDYNGLRAEDSHGHGWQKTIHSEDLPHLLEQWGSAVATGEPREAEARLRRFDGEYRWFLFRTSPITDATGVVVKWCGMPTTNADEINADLLAFIRGEMAATA